MRRIHALPRSDNAPPLLALILLFVIILAIILVPAIVASAAASVFNDPTIPHCIGLQP